MGGPQLLVIRHGETEWSRAGRHTGRTDVPLNEQGRDEARDAGRTLDGWSIARAYTSPLERARETAEIVGLDCDLTVDSDLVEWDYGIYEGKTTPQVRQVVPNWSIWTHPLTEGESIDDVGLRVDRFLSRVLAEVPTGNVAVFAHGHVLAVLIARWCGLASIEGRRFPLGTGSVSLLGWHREDRVLRALNHRVGDTLDPPFRT